MLPSSSLASPEEVEDLLLPWLPDTAEAPDELGLLMLPGWPLFMLLSFDDDVILLLPRLPEDEEALQLASGEAASSAAAGSSVGSAFFSRLRTSHAVTRSSGSDTASAAARRCVCIIN